MSAPPSQPGPLAAPEAAPVVAGDAIQPVAQGEAGGPAESSGERLPVLDLLRGIAILFILPANMPLYSAASEGMGSGALAETLGDHFVVALTLSFVDGKFITLLSILFGAGLAIQMDRAREAGKPFVWYYIRRMAILFCIGLAHALLLWFGDILSSYAIVGLGALLFGRLGSKWMLRVAGLCLVWVYGCLIVIAVGVALYALLAPQPGSEEAKAVKEKEAAQRPSNRGEEIGKQIEAYFQRANVERIYRNGPFWEMVLIRAAFVATFAVIFWIFIAWYLLACFLFGIHFKRSGLFHDPGIQQRWRKRLLLYGLSTGLVLELIALVLYILNPDAGWYILVNSIAALPMALGYLGLALWWAESGWAEWLQHLLRTVGRMALSVYLLESVLCGLIFYSYGLGLFGGLSRVETLGVIGMVWALLFAFSLIWMRFFQMGPVEWAWRSLAAGKVYSLVAR